jgi:hypothetical protein
VLAAFWRAGCYTPASIQEIPPMPILRAILSLSVLVLLVACGGEELPPDDIIWDPALTSPSGGELDLGAVENNQSVQAAITGLNNTDEMITFTVDVDLDAAEGWIVSSPPPQDIQPGDMIAVGPRFHPNANTPEETTGTVTFFYDDEVVTWILRASRAD